MSVAEDTQTITSPTVRAALRRWVFWIGVATGILSLALLGLGSLHASLAGQTLSPIDPGPHGAKALVEVLRQQGVTVAVTDSLTATEAAITDADTTTLVIHDENSILTDGQIVEAAGRAGTVILIAPNFVELNAVTTGVALAGQVSGTATADCTLPAVVTAKKVTVDGQGYRLIGDGTTGIRCLSSGDKVYSLIQVENASGTIAALGTTDALSNETIARYGNAALALNLLGQNKNLVWYVPSSKDLADQPLPTLAELTPGWVTQVTVLLLLTIVAAGFWRGRRMGPLIVENLPVTVRASETMHGRARLYENASARAHALDSLRIGTVARLGALCGLPKIATVHEVARAVAAITERDPASVESLLIDSQPSSDRQLLALSDALLALEQDVARSIRPK